VWRVLLLGLVVAACSDPSVPTDAIVEPSDILAALRALPNVADATEQATNDAGYHYIVLHFVQPVDHDDPSSATFLQEVSLLHRDLAAPLIVVTDGYWDYTVDNEAELTQLLQANQVSIEHRFFGTSRPDPADWTKLTIEQMADDEHAIVQALAQVYTGPRVASGASKGGMTATFYRRFFPDDVVATVPYVAPVMFSSDDERFPPFIAAIDPGGCHDAIRALAVDLLANHRAAMETRAMADAAQNGFAYNRIAIGPAVESAIEGLEWSFWQYYGVDECSMIPTPTATDDDLYSFLNEISPVSSSDDDQCAAFEGWVYQAFFQLGYPDDGTDAYLGPYFMYGAADFAGEFPAGVAQPAYDGGVAMDDIDGFVEEDAERMLFVYGQWDPWSGGAYTLRGTRDSLEVQVATGDHGSILSDLALTDEMAAFGKLQAWTGVSPPGFMRAALPHRPRALRPPTVARALRARLR